MKFFTHIFVALCVLGLTACSSEGDKILLYQVQMVNHISNVDATAGNPGKSRADAIVYQVVVNADKMTADITGSVILPDGKQESIHLTDLEVSTDALTGGYSFKQTANSRSQGSCAVTDFSGVLPLNEADLRATQFAFVAEKHYQVNATVPDFFFGKAKATITNEETGDVRTFTDCKFLFSINPMSQTATATIAGIDYDGNLEKEMTLKYENLSCKPTWCGYEITAKEAAVAFTDKLPQWKKYKLHDFKALVGFSNALSATYAIDGVGIIHVTQ